MAKNSDWGIRVLVAEDSPTVRRHLANMINETPGLRVVGEARDGEEAVALAQELAPDVISMDISMPGIDGLEATRRIMSRYPTPVVVVSSLVDHEIDLSFRAMQAGALAVVPKPPARNDPAFPSRHRQLVNTLMAMASVRVIRRWERAPGQNAVKPMDEAKPAAPRTRPAPEVVALGASAGGPSALRTLLGSLRADFAVPIVIVQHMPHEFVEGLARWLNDATPLRVQVATDGLHLEAGVVNLSPGTAHLKVERRKDDLVVCLERERGSYRYQPSVDVLFGSVATACGQTGAGIVLTGMGDDGTEGLLAMRQAGAYTFAQDEASCIVFGMPAAAIARGAVEQIVPLTRLAATLADLM